MVQSGSDTSGRRGTTAPRKGCSPSVEHGREDVVDREVSGSLLDTCQRHARIRMKCKRTNVCGQIPCKVSHAAPDIETRISAYREPAISAVSVVVMVVVVVEGPDSTSASLEMLE